MALVLVVDDNAANRDLVVALLGYRGHAVLEAADGGQALKLVQSERPDLVITDLLMPVLDGYELVRELRSDEAIAATPVIFYTANYRRDEVEPMATALGVTALLAKPIDPSEFLRLVEASLGTASAAPPVESERFQREHGRAVNAKLLDTVEELAVAENALRDSEARFRSLAEFSPIGIFALAGSGELTYVNPQLREICGIATAQDAPPQWRDLLHPDDRDRVAGELWQAIADRTHYATRLRLLRPDHGQRWVQMQVAPVPDASRQASFVGIVDDITDMVEAQRERAQMERRLQVSERLESLGQLAAGIAHDFNNLLAIILNYAQFADAGVTELAAATPDERWSQVQQDIAAVTGAAERAAQLTRQLLMFARRDVAHPEVLDVNDVVRGSISLLARTIGEHVRFEQHLAERLWPTCIDRGQFEQVLVNLVVNARDAVGAGGVITVETENVELDAEAAAGCGVATGGSYVRLTVSDDGAGMSPETRARAFEPFFSTKPTGSGTGLGLSTVYGIVTRFGGAVGIESEPGSTRITVTLPMHESAGTGDVGRGDSPAEPPVVEGALGRVLVAEDDRDIRSMIGRMLSEHGYSVVLADGGEAAMHALKDPEAGIDVLLTDVVMPGTSGRRLAERAETLRPGLPVLLMSGYAAGVFAPSTVGSDVMLLEKPFKPESLLAALAALSPRNRD